MRFFIMVKNTILNDIILDENETAELKEEKLEEWIFNYNDINESKTLQNPMYRYLYRTLLQDIFFTKFRQFLGLQKEKLSIAKRKIDENLTKKHDERRRIEEELTLDILEDIDKTNHPKWVELRKIREEINELNEKIKKIDIELKDNHNYNIKNRNIKDASVITEGKNSIENSIIRLLSFKDFIVPNVLNKEGKVFDFNFKENFHLHYNSVMEKITEITKNYKANQKDYSFISYLAKNRLLKDSVIDTTLKKIIPKNLNFEDNNIKTQTTFEIFKWINNNDFKTLTENYEKTINDLYLEELFLKNNPNSNIQGYQTALFKYIYKRERIKWFNYPTNEVEDMNSPEFKEFKQKYLSEIILIKKHSRTEYAILIKKIDSNVIHLFQKIQKVILNRIHILNQKELAKQNTLAEQSTARLSIEKQERINIYQNMNSTIYITNAIDFENAKEDIKKWIENERQLGENLNLPDWQSVEEYFNAVANSNSSADVNKEIIRFYNVILKTLVEKGVSDIHIHPMIQESKGHIQYKLHGSMYDFQTNLSWKLINQLIWVIENECWIEIKDDKPEDDGVIQNFVVNNKLIVNFRVAIQGMPSKRNEDMSIKKHCVLRVLKNDSIPTLSDLKMRDDVIEELNNTINSVEHGIYLVTWPTGSGKSTLLYSVLDDYKKKNPQKMIYSVENPVEKVLSSISQIEIDPKRNMSFQTVLKMLLRMDPDVIFVWEIRDPETATLAADASETWHFVLATLHVNSALEVVERLQALKVLPDKIRKTLVGACAQRLVGDLCPYCKETVWFDVFVDDMKRVHGITIDNGITETVYKKWPGCSHCRQTWVVGRIPIIEMINFKRIWYFEDTEWLKKKLAENSFISMFDRAFSYMIEEDSSIDYEAVIALYDANTDISAYQEEE